MLAALTGCGQAPATIADPISNQVSLLTVDRIDLVDGRGVYVAQRDAGETRIAFDLPVADLAPDRRHDMEQIGDTPEDVVVLLDRYASRLGQDGRCSDGREAFVRVFSLTARRELMSSPVESCLRNMPARPVEWLGDGRFRIGGPAPATFAISGTQQVKPVDGEGARG